MVLPCATLALLYAGIYGRVLRAGLRDALARGSCANGAGEGGSARSRVLVHHAMRLTLIPLVALFGLDFGSAWSAVARLLTEVVFGLHGVGKLTYDALQTLDLPMMMATVMYAALLVVIVVNALAPMPGHGR